MGKRSLIIALAVFSFGAFAQSSVQTERKVLAEVEPLKEGRFLDGQMEPFVGLGLGYMDENESLKTEGLPFNVKLVGSFFPVDSFVLDVGGGLISQTFNNQQAKDTVFSGLIEVAFRYRLPQNWQVGPIAKTYVFNGDEFGSSSDLFTTFIGGQLMHEHLLFGQFRNRLGVSLTTDVGIPNQTAFVTSIEAQFALGASEPAPVVSRDMTVIEEQQTAAIEEVAEPEVFTGEVFFELNQSELKQASDLSVFKSQDPKKLKSVEIVGYADSTGPNGLNLKISRDRARSVKQALIRAGIPEEKIKVRWVGESEAPRDQLDEPSLRKVDVKITQ